MDKLNPEVHLLYGHICKVGYIPPGKAAALEVYKIALERPAYQILFCRPL